MSPPSEKSILDRSPSVRLITNEPRSTTGTFADNLRLPVHRWFRYSAGFSAQWVARLLREKTATRVLDPFAGSGTTMLAADAVGVKSVGLEAHPFVCRIADAKPAWAFDPLAFNRAARRFLELSETLPAPADRMDDPLLGRIYTRNALQSLDRLRDAFREIETTVPQGIARLLWLALTRILRACSFVGTAQWQYVLPKKSKERTIAPQAAIREALDEIVEDRQRCAFEGWCKLSQIVAHDVRQPLPRFDDVPFDIVITSPPYPNNYDYADATRLEMTFWGEISGWSDLQSSVRRHLMRSCSQHSAAERLQLDPLLAHPRIDPIRTELRTVCERLGEVRLTKGGRKTYHTMIAAYFGDLADVLANLRAVVAPGATLCVVIGDSAPYGIHVPAERWLGELAVGVGFRHWHFEPLRARNVKWDNRVHDVPLHEGNLWIEG